MSHMPRQEQRRARPRLLLLTYLSGCTSWQAPQQVAPAQLIADRQPSAIRITRTDQSLFVLKHPTIVGDTLVGTLDSAWATGERRVMLSDVQKIEVRQTDKGETIALVAVGAVVVAFGVYLLACTGECLER